jgi:hypothetical protein
VTLGDPADRRGADAVAEFESQPRSITATTSRQGIVRPGLPARQASVSEYQAIPALVTSPLPFEPCHVVDRQLAIASL